jgi:hypothetical protein
MRYTNCFQSIIAAGFIHDMLKIENLQFATHPNVNYIAQLNIVIYWYYFTIILPNIREQDNNKF